MAQATDIRQWAWEEFGEAALGDRRRVTRLVDMAARLAERPGGRISDVYVRPGESQGAYDFVRNDAVSTGALVRAVGVATARRCAEYDRVIVAIDGSSLNLTDHAEKKGFGRVGSPRHSAGGKVSARGLKTLAAAAVGTDGVFLGLLDIQWWTRGAALIRRIWRPVAERETQRWVEAGASALQVLAAEAPLTRVCFVVDREGDSRYVLKALNESGHEFIVRSTWNRRLTGTKRGLHEQIMHAPVLGRYQVDLRRSGTRAARSARFEIRAMQVTVWDRRRRADNPFRMPINVVQIRELRPRAARLQWTLLTNRRVESFEQARAVAQEYMLRWRIEEFHRTWKGGHCNVEQTQLRHRDHVIRWAMIHAAVAARIERLKGLARTNPDALATEEFSQAELRALILVRHRFSKNRDDIDPGKVTVRQAIRWVGEMGGFTGGGRRFPGSVTLARGLERLAHYVEAFELVDASLEKPSRKR